MATVTKPIALDESLNTTELSSRNVADVLAQELQAVAGAIGGIAVPSADHVSYDNSGSGLSATDVQDAIDELASEKVDKEVGKGLSTNDYTTAEKTKLAGIAAGAEVNVQSDWNQTDPTQDDYIKNKPTADEQTATDEFTTINGGLLSSLKVALTPNQDLHGYDSPWVGGAGKNKLPMTVDGIKTANTEGTWSDNTYTNRGLTFTIITDTANNVTGIKINQVAMSNCWFIIAKSSNFKAENYILNGVPSGVTSGMSLRAVNASTSTTVGRAYQGGEVNVELSADTNLYFDLQIPNGSSFSDDVIYPMLRLATESDPTFEPYSNICPISGHTEVDLYNVGKNLYDGLSEVGSWVKQRCTATFNGDGSITATNTQSGSTWLGFIGTLGTTININNCPCSKGDSFIVTSGNNTVCSSMTVGEIDSNNILLKSTSITSGGTYTVTEDDTTAIVLRYNTNLDNGATGTIYPMIRKSTETDSTFEPYLGHLYQVQIGSTVYGGYVDLVTGVMVVTHGIVDLGGLTYEYNYTDLRFTATISNIKNANTRTLNGFCSCYEVLSDGRPYSSDFDGVIYNMGFVYKIGIHDHRYNDVTAFKTAISGQTFAYPLATPITLNLTPQLIETLAGQNNLSTPLDGQSIDSVKYREVFAFDDVEKVVSLRVPISMLGTDESGRTTASQSYASGDYFYKDGYMCKALTSISAGATLTLNTNYEYSTLDEILESKVDKSDIYANAGSHNSIYRGKYLGSSVTASQWTAIQNGTFEDLFIGDYWTINGVNWRIAHFDYWYRVGDTECTDHHVVIVPDTRLYVASMNSTNITTGGYYNSEMRGGANYLLQNSSGLYDAKVAIDNAFGSSHILTHRETLTNAVSSGNASGWAWYDSSVDLMSEVMVYGTLAWSNGGKGYEVGDGKGQLALFRHDISKATNRVTWWLRGVYSAAAFAYVNSYGLATADSASDSRGVRPAFAIK